MKTLKIDLNKLSKEQIQAYLMLAEVGEVTEEVGEIPTDEKIKEDNKEWMKDKDLPEFPEDEKPKEPSTGDFIA